MRYIFLVSLLQSLAICRAQSASTQPATTQPTSTQSTDAPEPLKLDLSGDRSTRAFGWTGERPSPPSKIWVVDGPASVKVDPTRTVAHQMHSVGLIRDRHDIVTGVVLIYPKEPAADAYQDSYKLAAEFQLNVLPLKAFFDQYMHRGDAGGIVLMARDPNYSIKVELNRDGDQPVETRFQVVCTIHWSDEARQRVPASRPEGAVGRRYGCVSDVQFILGLSGGAMGSGAGQPGGICALVPLN